MGRLHVDEMLAEMTSREWAEWMAYWECDPWGETRADYRMGILAATTANLWQDKRRLKPEDFLPQFGRPRMQTRDEMIFTLKKITAMCRGTIQ